MTEQASARPRAPASQPPSRSKTRSATRPRWPRSQGRGRPGQGPAQRAVDQRSTQAAAHRRDRLGRAHDCRAAAARASEAPRALEQVAGQVERVGDYLKDASGDRILRDVEDFARRQPMLVTAAGVALGFAASRFLKASSSRRYQSGYQRATGAGRASPQQ